MFLTENPSVAYIKERAKSLKAYLVEKGINTQVTHCQCLNEVAKAFGFKSYNGYLVSVRKKAQS